MGSPWGSRGRGLCTGRGLHLGWVVLIECNQRAQPRVCRRWDEDLGPVLIPGLKRFVMSWGWLVGVLRLGWGLGLTVWDLQTASGGDNEEDSGSQKLLKPRSGIWVGVGIGERRGGGCERHPEKEGGCGGGPDGEDLRTTVRWVQIALGSDCCSSSKQKQDRKEAKSNNSDPGKAPVPLISIPFAIPNLQHHLPATGQ